MLCTCECIVNYSWLKILIPTTIIFLLIFVLINIRVKLSRIERSDWSVRGFLNRIVPLHNFVAILLALGVELSVHALWHWDLSSEAMSVDILVSYVMHF